MSREDNIYYARLAEQGERYEDMIRYMKQVSNVSINKMDSLNLSTPPFHIIIEVYLYKTFTYFRVVKSCQTMREIS